MKGVPGNAKKTIMTEMSNMENIMSRFTGKYSRSISLQITRTLEKYHLATGSPSIDIAAFQVFYPQLAITKRIQRNEYNLSQFFSELGGSTGLVLGISLLSIVQFLDSLITYAKYIIPYAYR